MKHQGMKLYKIDINHGPEMTLTYFTARSTEVTNSFEWGKLVKLLSSMGKLARSMQMDRRFMFMKKMSLEDCLPLPPEGNIHAYEHNIQTSSMKQLGQSKDKLHVEHP